jgi:hypothetical protein
MKITTGQLKSLNEVVSSISTTNNDRNFAEGYINSLTEKARQISSKKMEDEDEKEEEGEEEEMEDEDEKEEMPPAKKRKTMAEESQGGSKDPVEEIMKRLAARALKKAKKKARRSSEDDYAGSKPKAASYDPDMKNSGAIAEEVELVEKAAPGYEDWASDPKVKASFKKQYGKRWKQVMYAKSWKMSKMDEETELAEGVKRMRRLRTSRIKKWGTGQEGKLKGLDAAYDKELAKLSANRLRRGGARKSTIRSFMSDKPTTAAADKAYEKFSKGAMQKASARGKKIFEDETLDEGFQAKRLRVIRKEIGKGEPTTGKTKEFLEKTYKRKLARNKALAAKYPERSAKYGGGQQGNMLLRAALRKKAMDAKGLSTRGPSEETLFEALQAKLNRAKGKAYKLGMAGKTNAHAKAMRRAAELQDKVAAMQARRGDASPEAVKAAGNIVGKRGVPTKKGMKLADERRSGQLLFRARARDAEQRGRNATPSQKAEKRKSQKGMAAFRNAARSGDFGQNNAAGLRVRSNFEKKYGRLKGK